MRTILSIALIGLLALTSLWLLFSGASPDQSQNSTPTDVALRDTAEGPLIPSVVLTATKLGQGRPAVPGLPTAVDFETPQLKVTAAGTALLIPGGDLPAKQTLQTIAPLDGLAGGATARIRFDIYSWSMGTLVATTPQWIELMPNKVQGVPDVLTEVAGQLPGSERLMLVLPPGADVTPPGSPALNAYDAHIVLAEVLLPNS